MAGPLSLPDFRYLFSARAISYVGTYLAPIAVAFAILDNGGGPTAVGLSFAAWTLAQVAMLALGGVVGDRVPRRLVMIGSDVASTAACVSAIAINGTSQRSVTDALHRSRAGPHARRLREFPGRGLARVPSALVRRAMMRVSRTAWAWLPILARKAG